MKNDMDSYFKVSVRLMCYNQEKYIAQAMDGIMMQKVDFPVEVVVGDDFSQDSTLSIVRSYSDTKWIKVRILKREVGDAYWTERQKRGRLYNYYDILKNCKGEYIALLDGDDYWTDPYKLQKQVQFLERNSGYAICSHEVHELHFQVANTAKAGLGILWNNWRFGGWVALFRVIKKLAFDRREFWKCRVGYKTDTRFRIYSFLDILCNKHFMATSSIMIRREVVDKVGLWYTATDGGHYFVVLLALSVGKGYHFKEFMGVYNRNPGSITLDPNRKRELAAVRKKNRIYRLERLLEVVPEFRDEIKQQIASEGRA